MWVAFRVVQIKFFESVVLAGGKDVGVCYTFGVLFGVERGYGDTFVVGRQCGGTILHAALIFISLGHVMKN